VFPLSLKKEVKFELHSPEIVFGEPIDSPGTPFEIRENEITEIYNFVRNDVIRRFARFFQKAPSA